MCRPPLAVSPRDLAVRRVAGMSVSVRPWTEAKLSLAFRVVVLRDVVAWLGEVVWLVVQDRWDDDCEMGLKVVGESSKLWVQRVEVSMGLLALGAWL